MRGKKGKDEEGRDGEWRGKKGRYKLFNVVYASAHALLLPPTHTHTHTHTHTPSFSNFDGHGS